MIDYRKPLKPGTILDFPGYPCTITSTLGCGSNAIVYQAFYPDSQYPDLKHLILVKELYPLLKKEVITREQDQSLSCSDYSDSDFLLHHHSYDQANSIHLKLQSLYPQEIDTNQNTFSLNNTLYTILCFSGGRTLEKEFGPNNRSGIPLRLQVQRMLGILDVLDSFHQAGLLHLDLSPDNILLIGTGKKERTSLIDYNSVQSLEDLQKGKNSYLSIKAGYTAPEILSGRRNKIGFSSDLYSLTSIFYWMISGQTRTNLQVLQNRIPDITKLPSLEGTPDPVISKITKIFKKGLISIPERRYQSISQMRDDFLELLDRIDGLGITHAALWDYAHAYSQKLLSDNPALHYLRDSSSLFPLMTEDYSGTRRSLTDWIDQISGSCGKTVFLSGSGGAGKTTALLAAAKYRSLRYHECAPAPLYLPLCHMKEGDTSFIQDQILLRMRFNREICDMDMARIRLKQLLSEPFHTKYGDVPKAILLLDAINEVTGDLTGLVSEIQVLSELEGVRIILSGRTLLTDFAEQGFCPTETRLLPLTKAEVLLQLSSNGLLAPEKDEILELLRSPMMLSLYLQSAENSQQQLRIQSQEDLLSYYLNTFLVKEKRIQGFENEEYWQTYVALKYILPACAALFRRRHAISHDQLYPFVEKCYLRLSSKAFRKVFPELIGHTREIKGNSENADHWYGLMIIHILWQKLGLLVRNENGEYRIYHQMAEEFLGKQGNETERIFLRHERLRRMEKAAFYTVFISGCLLLSIGIYKKITKKKPYDETKAEQVLSHGLAAYEACRERNENLRDFIELLKNSTDTDDYRRSSIYNKVLDQIDSYQKEDAESISEKLELEYKLLDQLLGSGEVMPWSEEVFDSAKYKELLSLCEIQEEQCAVLATASLAFLQDNSLSSLYTDLKISDQLPDSNAGRNDSASAYPDMELMKQLHPNYLEDIDSYLTQCDRLLACYYLLLFKPELSSIGEEDPELANQLYYVSHAPSEEAMNSIGSLSEDIISGYNTEIRIYDMGYMRDIYQNLFGE